MVLQYFIVFHDSDSFEDCSPFWKMSLHLDSSVSLELDSGCAVVQDCYKSDVYLSASYEDARGVCLSRSWGC